MFIAYYFDLIICIHTKLMYDDIINVLFYILRINFGSFSLFTAFLYLIIAYSCWSVLGSLHYLSVKRSTNQIHYIDF